MSNRLVLAGGSGFLGRLAATWFTARGVPVTVLSRRDPKLPGVRFVWWDGRRLGNWVNELNGAAALINFCGRSVNCRYDERHRAEILHSRVETTRLLGRALEACVQPPRHWLNASTATIYRHAEDHPMDERHGEPGKGFSEGVAQAWEAAFFAARPPATRQTALRLSLVLGWDDHSAYPTLRRLTRLGLGGPHGNGRQRVSWIHARDYCRALEFLLRSPLDGPVNLSAPEAPVNRDFMSALRQSLGVPFGLSCPGPLLRAGAWLLRTAPELVLKSRWVAPARLQEAGFQFQFASLTDALADLAHGPRPLVVPAQAVAAWPTPAPLVLPGKIAVGTKADATAGRS